MCMEIMVERHANPSLIACESKDLKIGRLTQPDIPHMDCVNSEFTQNSGRFSC
jgi:hypothetical protein